MFRNIALSACLLAVFAQTASPVFAGGCRQVVVPTTFVTPAVQIEPAVVAVPQIFLQIVNPQPVQIQAAPQPRQTLDVDKLDQLIRERVDLVLRSRGAASELPPISDAPLVSNDLLTVAMALNTKCASCHTAGNNPRKGIVLFSSKDVFEPNVSLSVIDAQVKSGSMPPAAKGNPHSPASLPAAEQNLLHQLASK